MAKVITVVDDLHVAEDGSQVPATVTRRISFGPEECEIDLSAAHDAELWKLLMPYFAAGRPLRGRGRAKTRGITGITTLKRSRAENAAMREWADANGYSYETPAGGWYYGRPLLEAWYAHKDEAHLEFPEKEVRREG